VTARNKADLCEECGRTTTHVLECCGTTRCADYMDAENCAERHFWDHTWCEMCEYEGIELRDATRRVFWHRSFLTIECRYVDLCEVCAVDPNRSYPHDPSPCELCETSLTSGSAPGFREGDVISSMLGRQTETVGVLVSNRC